jgi:hypothetical protein
MNSPRDFLQLVCACALLRGSTTNRSACAAIGRSGTSPRWPSKPPIEEEPIAVSPNAEPKCPIWNVVTNPGPQSICLLNA